MLAHPAVISRLSWMLGAGYTVSQNTALCHVRGSSGQMLHAGNANPCDSQHNCIHIPDCLLGCAAWYSTSVGKIYEMVSGRIHTTSNINVAWNLRDVQRSDGGFCIVPGSRACTQKHSGPLAACGALFFSFSDMRHDFAREVSSQHRVGNTCGVTVAQTRATTRCHTQCGRPTTAALSVTCRCDADLFSSSWVERWLTAPTDGNPRCRGVPPP
jgi:hypothetical protein